MGAGAPSAKPIVSSIRPILMGIGMFTGGYDLDFDPWPHGSSGYVSMMTNSLSG